MDTFVEGIIPLITITNSYIFLSEEKKLKELERNLLSIINTST